MKWEPHLIGMDHNPKFLFGCMWYIVHTERFGWSLLKDFDNSLRMDHWNWNVINMTEWYNGIPATRWLDKNCKGAWSACYSVEERSKLRMFFELEEDMIAFQGVWVHQNAIEIRYSNFFKNRLSEDFAEAEQWCIENCNSYLFEDGYSFYFTDENDAMRFKLVWGNNV